MRLSTILFALLLLCVLPTQAQEIEYDLNVPLSEDYFAPYSQGVGGAGIQSGARAVAGPYDLDGDGLQEVLVSDYTAGGRVHVVEATGADTWALAYSTPALDSTSTTNNIRTITGGDLDGDGASEIIFLAGRGYSETNPNIDALPAGLYVFEFNGTDFGDAPAAVYEFSDDQPDRWRAEQMTTADIDGDGFEELMFGNNGSDNRYDNWYILSVTGDIGSGFETFVVEARLSSRGSEDFDPVERGGGSPYAVHPADLDGDGTPELVFHSWNNLNFFIGDVTGADAYAFPADGADAGFLQAGPGDFVSLFGGAAADMDGNGDEEVFFPVLQTGGVTVVNYEDGEDITRITTDNVVFDLITGISALGIAAGDADGNGLGELYGSGPGYSPDDQVAGEMPTWVRTAEFTGGDVEDPANYQIGALDFSADFDTAAENFDLIRRDSLGTVTEYLESTAFSGKDRAGGHPGQGDTFVSKLAFLGDADGDGVSELAVAYQGVDDSTYVINEVWDAGQGLYVRSIAEARPVENRVFLRIVSLSSAGLAVDPQRDLPQGYALSANFPNPFNPTTTFTFTLPQQQRVTVRVYDAMGRVVRTLVADGLYTAGQHQATWDGRNAAGVQAASGTYFYTLEFDGYRAARPMVLVK